MAVAGDRAVEPVGPGRSADEDEEPGGLDLLTLVGGALGEREALEVVSPSAATTWVPQRTVMFGGR